MTVSKATENVSYQCRLLRHAWELMSRAQMAELGLQRSYRNGIHLRCLRCGAYRHDEIDTIGGLQSRRYDYPEEYQTAAEERPSQADLRLWVLKRSRRLTRSFDVNA